MWRSSAASPFSQWPVAFIGDKACQRGAGWRAQESLRRVRDWTKIAFNPHLRFLLTIPAPISPPLLSVASTSFFAKGDYYYSFVGEVEMSVDPFLTIRQMPPASPQSSLQLAPREGATISLGNNGISAL